MTITRVTRTTGIKVDQWICKGPMFRDSICDRPVKVTRVSASRVYYYSPSKAAEKFCAIHTIAFVCDTCEEGERLHEVSEAQRAALNDARSMHKAMIDALITAAVPA